MTPSPSRLVFLSQPPRREQAAVALATAAGLTFAFYATDHHMAAESLQGLALWSPRLPLDDRIPLRQGWVWVYLLYFPVCFTPLLFKEVWRDIRTFRRTALGFGVQFTVALAFFWALPSKIFRPEIIPDGLTGTAMAWLYRIDPGFNVFPSLHVANLAYISSLAWRLKGPRWGAVLWVLFLLIALSTLLVKQHYLVDLPAGLLVGLFGYRVAFR